MSICKVSPCKSDAHMIWFEGAKEISVCEHHYSILYTRKVLEEYKKKLDNTPRAS